MLSFLLLQLLATVVPSVTCVLLSDATHNSSNNNNNNSTRKRIQLPARLQHVALAGPFDLHQGQVARSLHALQGVPNSDSTATTPELFAIYSVHVELVTLDSTDGSIQLVPQTDALLRRHVLSRPLERRRPQLLATDDLRDAMLDETSALLTSRQSILVAGGAEAQGGHAYTFPYPYAFAAAGTARIGADASQSLLQDDWLVHAHVINTQNLSRLTRARCSDCPCTLEDRKANARINGEVVPTGQCSAQLQNNTACAFETYVGGLHCCVDGEFCLERDALAIHAAPVGTSTERVDTGIGAGTGTGTRVGTTSGTKAGITKSINDVGDDGEDAVNRSVDTKAAPTPLVTAAAPISSFYLQYSIEYAAADDTNRWLYVATCCDASGDLDTPGNVEYDVPACSSNDGSSDNDACVHNLTTYQRVDSGDVGNPVWDPKRSSFAPVRPPPLVLVTDQHNASSDDGNDTDTTDTIASTAEPPASSKPPLHINPSLDPDRKVDLVFAVAHQHQGALGIRLYHPTTGDLLCASLPTYTIGDEGDTDTDAADQSASSRSRQPRPRRLVGMEPCVFEPAVRLRASDALRIEALYDSSEARIGAQSLVYIAIHDVDAAREQQSFALQQLDATSADDTEQTIRIAAADVVDDLHDLSVLLAAVAAALAMLALVLAVLKRRRARCEYSAAPQMSSRSNSNSAKLALTAHGRYSVAETHNIDESSSLKRAAAVEGTNG